jgi:hypothetical protein
LFKCQFIFKKYRERGITLTHPKVVQGVRNDGIPEPTVPALSKVVMNTHRDRTDTTTGSEISNGVFPHRLEKR